MRLLFEILIPVSLLAVLVALGFGLFALFKGGDFGRSYSNKLMRLRVLLDRTMGRRHCATFQLTKIQG